MEMENLKLHLTPFLFCRLGIQTPLNLVPAMAGNTSAHVNKPAQCSCENLGLRKRIQNICPSHGCEWICVFHDGEVH
jgi:hypothetical protein